MDETRNGISVRNLMTLLIYAKALAYFRGNAEVELDDVRQVLPFVLHDKLQPDLQSPGDAADAFHSGLAPRGDRSQVTGDGDVALTEVFDRLRPLLREDAREAPVVDLFLARNVTSARCSSETTSRTSGGTSG